jgi:hypothetical protein
MALKTSKPEPRLNGNIEDFIKGAAGDIPVREELSGKKDKSFLLKLPFTDWKKAKQKAFDSDLSLHDYILQAIIEKSSH